MDKIIITIHRIKEEPGCFTTYTTTDGEIFTTKDRAEKHQEELDKK